MTGQTDERRRQRGAMLPLRGRPLYYCVGDPENSDHQMAAQMLYHHRREEHEPTWSTLSRAERVPYYSLTESLFGG